MAFQYKTWYEENKERLSEKKKKLYRENTSYRDGCLERSRSQRETKSQVEVGDHTLSFADAAGKLEISIWALREWRKKNYFPEPQHRNGRLWFTEYQVFLLQRIKVFFVENGIRMGVSKRGGLEDLVVWIYANW